MVLDCLFHRNSVEAAEKARLAMDLIDSLESTTRSLLFQHYYEHNHWGDPDSRSGGGSNLEQTAVIRAQLPALFRRWQIHTLLDAACGDRYWWLHLDHGLDRYIGVDIVPQLIQLLRGQLSSADVEYRCLDVAVDPLPRATAILCRDLLVHFDDDLLLRTVENLRRSGSRYLITTTFPGRPNTPVTTGDWRPIDLEGAPFSFPPPLDLINEGCTMHGGRYPDKSLALWRFADLPIREPASPYQWDTHAPDGNPTVEPIW